jgi:hypothetical protein
MGYTLHAVLPSQRATVEASMTMGTDHQILALWAEWKRELHSTLATSSQEISDRRHEKVEIRTILAYIIGEPTRSVLRAQRP